MIKSKQHPPQTPAEHAAEVARVRQIQAAAHPDHQPWAESHEECPTCGTAVEAVNAEPLDFDVRDGVLMATSTVRVMLPCGHTSIHVDRGDLLKTDADQRLGAADGDDM